MGINRNILLKVNEKEAFILENHIINSIQKLCSKLKKIDDKTFLIFANNDKNDFATWIENVYGDTLLGKKVRESENRLETIRNIEDHVWNNKTIIIIGGNATGLSCAARLRRNSERINIIVLEKGNYVSYGDCGTPYYISGVIREKESLILNTPETLKEVLNLDVRINSEVINVDNAKKSVEYINKEGKQILKYDYLIISSGSKPFMLPIKGLDKDRIFTLSGIEDSEKIKKYIEEKQVKKASILGGGFIGLELAENFRKKGIEVSMIELKNHLASSLFDYEMSVMFQKNLWYSGVKIFLNDKIDEIIHNKEDLTLKLASKKEIETDMLIYAVGVKPNIDFLKNTNIEIGKSGGIIVKETLQTNDESVYAGGGTIQFKHMITKNDLVIPLAGLANKQGRVIADNIFGEEIRYPELLGTGICKINNITIASTGVSEEILKFMKKEYEKIYLSPLNHPSYYPNTSKLTMKFMFEKNSGKILGAQIIGKEGVDKYIDILSFAMQNNIPIYDIKYDEFAYAPPFESPKTPIILASYLASNINNDEIKIINPEDFKKEEYFILDTRTSLEFEISHLDGATNIPLSEIRERLKEIPKDKKILVYCEVGQRGYFTCKILKNNGYSCFNMNGGYEMYQNFFEKIDYNTLPKIEITKRDNESKDNKNICIDAKGLKCPGPIIKLQKSIDHINKGEIIEIESDDIPFVDNLKYWTTKTENKILEVRNREGVFSAMILKGKDEMKKENKSTTIQQTTKKPEENKNNQKNKITYMITTDDLKKVTGALMSATLAISMGTEITLFFTFDGIKLLLKKNQKTKTEKIGKKSYLSVNEKDEKCDTCTSFLIQDYLKELKENNAKIMVCSMILDLIGYKKEELIEGIDFVGIMNFNYESDESKNTFIL